ncbi:hypothetical protein M0805_002912 [Coniferiporia weirii]|nr:hypothetical protein M0805_002912 [Coniferiporia weirii]
MEHRHQLEVPSGDMITFRKALAESKDIIAIAGAGLSSASGIPTFRGAGGMWRQFNAMSLATPEAFQRNPSRVWQFYSYRREKALATVPNAAHYALAQFSLPAFRHILAPDSTFTLITQNVDGLSRRALDAAITRAPPPELASSAPAQPYILEMHGSLFDIQCTASDCGHAEWNDASPICPALAGTEELLDPRVNEPELAEADLPHCRKCGALVRPGVVWFGEVPVHMETIDALVNKADLCLVVGTSSTVYPAAGYADIVRENGGKVAVFNLERSAGSEDADFLFLGPCEDILPKALGFQSSY